MAKTERVLIRGADEKRLRLYVLALLVSTSLYLALHGTTASLLVFSASMAMVAASLWRAHRALLPLGASLILLLATINPVIIGAVDREQSMAAIIGATQVWPQILIAIFAGRIFACQQELSFKSFWTNPLTDTHSVSAQSFLAAIALGIFLTLLHYTVISNLASASVGETSSHIFVGALTGSTIIHALIIFLFFVILAFIAEAIITHWSDRADLNRIRRFFRNSSGLPRAEIRSALAAEFEMIGHHRAMRLIVGAIEVAEAENEKPFQFASESFDQFHRASRNFIRALIPFLTLLGFLGTVIGLSAAVAELPGDLTGAQGGLDISASLAGLAVKFETTLLGLVATMVLSFLFNLLEKQEQQLAAECLLIVHQEINA